jgi:ribosomal protein S18 acetylase RimI-like enzyme
MSDEGLELELHDEGVDRVELPPPQPARLVDVRAAAPADVAGLAAAVCDLPLLQRYGTTEEGLRHSLEGALERGEGLIVVTREGQPVGLAWFLEQGTFALGGYLRLIAIAPACQGLRLGGLLLDEVERRVAAHARALFLFVSDFNVDAQRFYERRGYQHTGTLRAFVRPDIDELVYCKRLR